MYALRRHQRKLHFPAGLLALAWVLLMGCLIIRADDRAVTRRVMQVNFPPLPKYAEANTFWPPTYFPASFRNWRTVELSGQPQADAAQLRRSRAYLAELAASPNDDWGVSVKFSEQSSYSSLIAVLDMPPQVGIKMYWLSAGRTPTFYAYSRKPAASLFSNDIGWLCGFKSKAVPPPSVPWTTEFQLWLTSALSPAAWQRWLTPTWRWSTVLLTLLVLAALRQLRTLGHRY